jgi:hypothetical protein
MLFTEFAGIEKLAVKLRVFVNARDIPVKQQSTGNKRSETVGSSFKRSGKDYEVFSFSIVHCSFVIGEVAFLQ